ncbi:outer membrane beta-barrel protein [Algoriphagus winogradskyi]|uniref:Outer membrane protein beta-barrel domain-containing protein n=1 Tax=Algoriphagus winogradskyi TaxID=237017 RepID=A0ABY1N7F5_9BACT|nr:outer membrane beta-barrel protein [Algoriphagus winogradskyi]SMP02000.1 Outer membrane protein beta-barrel domain-containing protein [Algoriphagus winogradskyi]
MKKIILSTIAFLFAVTVINEVQAQQFQQGQMDLNIGVGLVPTFGTGDVGIPLSASLDYGITDQISIGGYLGYAGSNDNIPFLGKISYTYLIFGARGAYHFELTEKLDTYAGLLLGYNVASVSIENSSPGMPEPDAAGGFTYSVFGGARYHFNEKIGAFGEIGYGISVLNLGLTVKLK